MTIDSESETEKKPTKKGPKKQVVPKIEDEDIVVSKEFNIEDIQDITAGTKKERLQAGKFENKQLWSYSDALKSDRPRADEEDLEGIKEFTLEDRIEKKLRECGINIDEAAGLKTVDQDEEQK